MSLRAKPQAIPRVKAESNLVRETRKALIEREGARRLVRLGFRAGRRHRRLGRDPP
jgi:hypothetical protein